MEKYDMLLFEHLHSATNHQKDVYIIAKLLRSVGWNVAILDVFHEINEDYIEDIPVISLAYNGVIPNDKFLLRKSNTLYRLFSLTRYLIQQYIYMKNVCLEIKTKADSFYIGSYLFFPTTAFLRLKKPCYYWGLRSTIMQSFCSQMHGNLKMQAPYLYYANWLFKRNRFQRLFVSNIIIKNEFISNGFPDERLIIREERPYSTLTVNNRKVVHTDETIFLVIGLLRPEKKIIETIQAFKTAGVKSSKLLIVGRCFDIDYNLKIQNEINNSHNIIRVDGFIPEDIFQNYYDYANYVLFADSKGPCCITNGTMQEALIHKTPIIAPAYQPYKYYIQEFEIGLLYSPNDRISYAEVLKAACLTNSDLYLNKINRYLETIKFEKIAHQLGNDLNKIKN